MPSASVIAATTVKAGERPQLPDRKPDIVPAFLEPLRQAHLTISLSAQVHARAFEVSEVTNARQDDVARRLRVQAALDELARAQLDMEGELLVHFLIERHAPEPGTKRAISSSRHCANRIRDTPAANCRHAAVSASSCARPCRVRR